MKTSLISFILLGVVVLAAKPGLPRVSLGPLPKQSAGAGKPGVAQMGVHRKIDVRLLDKGKWNKSEWKLVLQSPGARGLRLHVTGMDLANGTLTVRGEDGETQSFRDQGPNGDGDFWTGLVNGDSVTVELQTSRKGSLPFRLPELSHLWALP